MKLNLDLTATHYVLTMYSLRTGDVDEAQPGPPRAQHPASATLLLRDHRPHRLRHGDLSDVSDSSDFSDAPAHTLTMYCACAYYVLRMRLLCTAHALTMYCACTYYVLTIYSLTVYLLCTGDAPAHARAGLPAQQASTTYGAVCTEQYVRSSMYAAVCTEQSAVGRR